jgi:hypothetical protein
MNPVDVYVYGMTVLPTIHKLKGDYPKADTYQEIEQTIIIPGGEAANSAEACTRFPSVHEPPALHEIEALMKTC